MLIVLFLYETFCEIRYKKLLLLKILRMFQLLVGNGTIEAEPR